MAGLVLSLRPNEKFLVNGVVLQNGDRRAQIRVESDAANVLRLSDALHPDNVKTPTRRVYYSTQLMITGDVSIDDGLPTVLEGLKQLSHAFMDPEAKKVLAKATDAMNSGRYYSVLNSLKRLFPLEDELLAMGSETKGSEVEEVRVA